MSTLEDELVSLRQENVDHKTKLKHWDKEVARLGYELSTWKIDNLEVENRVSRLEMEMEDFQNALKDRQEIILAWESQIATLQQ